MSSIVPRTTSSSSSAVALQRDATFGSLVQTLRSLSESRDASRDDPDFPDRDDMESSHSDSGASSLDEDEIRDVVRQVLTMVKHHRQNSRRSTSSLGGSEPRDGHGGGGGSRSTSNSAQPPRSESSPRGEPSLAQVATFMISAGSAVGASRPPPAVVSNWEVEGPQSVRAERAAPSGIQTQQHHRQLHSANVATYASLVGIALPSSRSRTPDVAPRIVMGSTSATGGEGSPFFASGGGAGGGSAAATTRTVVAAATTEDGENTARRIDVSTLTTSDGDPVAAASSAAPKPHQQHVGGAIRFSRRGVQQQTAEASNLNAAGLPRSADRSVGANPAQGQQHRLQQQSLLTPDDENTRRAAQPRMPSPMARELSVGNGLLLPRVADYVPQPSSSLILPLPDDAHVAAEQRRVVRIERERQDALQNETFLPRTSRHEVPAAILDAPLRSKDRWEDRLYTEYLSRKKRKELEWEALRLAKKSQEELRETLEECTFQPEIQKIHDQNKSFKRSAGDMFSQSLSATTSTNPADRAAVATARLFSKSSVDRAQRDAVARAYAVQERRMAEAAVEKAKRAKATETQQRLYRESELRRHALQQLAEEQAERERVGHFTFQIKGTTYETSPLPMHADPGSFQRLYHEQFRRQESRDKLVAEAASRRPSPTPQITAMAKRRARSAQPVFERLSKRSTSPCGNITITRDPGAGGDCNMMQQALSPLSPLHSDALHALSLQPGGRSELIIGWMGKTAGVCSRQNSLTGKAGRSPTSRGPGGGVGGSLQFPNTTVAPSSPPAAPHQAGKGSGGVTQLDEVETLNQTVAPPPALYAKVVASEGSDST